MRLESHKLTAALVAATALLAACGGGGGDPTAGQRKTTLAVSVPPLVDAPPGLTGSVFCNNERFGAVVVDNVEVPPGMACELSGTTVQGSVKVGAGAILLAGNGVQVAGTIQSDQASHVELTGSTSRVAGNFEVKGGGSATLAGAEIAGTVAFEEMNGELSVGGARAGGGMKVIKNLGGGTIANNVVIGALQCFDNAPAPAVSGNSADSLEGQCFQAASPPPPTPPSGNVTCVGLMLVGLNLDSVIVPDNAVCTLVGSRMNGSVEVGANATLNMQDAFITGNLISDGAAVLNVGGSTSVGGSVQVQGGAGASLVGMRIGGSLQIDAMAGPVSASGNQIAGNTQVFSNRGGITLADNTISGVMQCTGNLPAPTGGGNVAAQKENQCAGL